MGRPRATIALHIERLVLDGFALGPGQERLVRAALEAELGRLLAAGGLAAGLAGGGAVPALRVAPLRAAGGDAAGLGRQVARAVYGGLGGDATKE
jgi:hypothetical protein